MINKFGFVQGRLTSAPKGELQLFPQNGWQEEFSIAGRLGINYIELIAERVHNERNPLWSKKGLNEIKNLSAVNNLELFSFCNDYIINNNLLNTNAADQTIRLIDQGKTIGMQKLVIPLFEESELTRNNYKNFKEVLSDIAKAAANSGITICLETVLTGKDLLKALEFYGQENIGCVFDTGNRIAFGHDIYYDIILLNDYINHVHIKDKNKSNENVLLGTGLVNFQKAFKSLNEINYKGHHTFETVRGKNPIKTAEYNIRFSEYFINEAE